jgi:hypothetical protein
MIASLSRPFKGMRRTVALQSPAAVSDALRGADNRPPDQGTLVVWGLLARYPFGGMTWQVLHHLVGFRRLGFDVWYVEDSDSYVYDPTTWWRTADVAANVAYLDRQLRRVGLGDRWVFRAPGTQAYFGALDGRGLQELYRRADAAFNVCDAQELEPRHSAIARLVLLETDPVASQVGVAVGDEAVIRWLDRYDDHFTYGANLGGADCRVPLRRYQWHGTRPPVCVDWWGDNGPPSRRALTTVTNWRHDDGHVTFEGETWRWTKHDTLVRFIGLGARAALRLELALGRVGEEDVASLRRHGWWVRPPLSDPDEYRAYIRGSLGEFTISKEVVVRSRSGWFSDRSACYLAAGRPVITQDTGLGTLLPTGEGLLVFTDEAEALAAIEDVAGDYERHADAAREIAREFFAAERVLADVLSRCGSSRRPEAARPPAA